MLTCVDAGHAIVLASDRSVVCWEGDHSAKALASLISFAFYVPLSVMIAPMFVDADTNKADIKYSKVFGKSI